ncbi:hypothetical protein D3C86_2123270 [compost metagenome]
MLGAQLCDETGRAVGGPVVHHQDLVGIIGPLIEEGAQGLLEDRDAIVGGHHHAELGNRH